MRMTLDRRDLQFAQVTVDDVRVGRAGNCAQQSCELVLRLFLCVPQVALAVFQCKYAQAVGVDFGDGVADHELS